MYRLYVRGLALVVVVIAVRPALRGSRGDLALGAPSAAVAVVAGSTLAWCVLTLGRTAPVLPLSWADALVLRDTFSSEVIRRRSMLGVAVRLAAGAMAGGLIGDLAESVPLGAVTGAMSSAVVDLSRLARTVDGSGHAVTPALGVPIAGLGLAWSGAPRTWMVLAGAAAALIALGTAWRALIRADAGLRRAALLSAAEQGHARVTRQLVDGRTWLSGALRRGREFVTLRRTMRSRGPWWLALHGAVALVPPSLLIATIAVASGEVGAAMAAVTVAVFVTFVATQPLFVEVTRPGRALLMRRVVPSVHRRVTLPVVGALAGGALAATVVLVVAAAVGRPPSPAVEVIGWSAVAVLLVATDAVRGGADMSTLMTVWGFELFPVALAASRTLPLLPVVAVAMPSVAWRQSIVVVCAVAIAWRAVEGLREAHR